MKPRTQIILVLGVLLGVAVLSSIQRRANSDRAPNGIACCPLMSALDPRPVAAATGQVSTSNPTAEQIIATYFHATARCETCLMIEHLAKAVIEQQFSADLAMNRLMLTSVNYELPENAHFLSDYKLPCPSLVLVRQGGKDEKWKLLGETWQLVHNPHELNTYFETEVRNFLVGDEQPTSSNQSAPTHAPKR